MIKTLIMIVGSFFVLPILFMVSVWVFLITTTALIGAFQALHYYVLPPLLKQGLFSKNS